jgi:hypothetical protein
MEEISLILGDSSDIYEFSSKQVEVLDDRWEGSWVVAQTLGGTPVVQGDLIKNIDIYNEDSLVGEDYKKSYKLFEGQDGELLEFNEDVIADNITTVSGKIYTEASDGTKIGVANRYAYITVKGVFVPHTRELRIKTDADGNFTTDFDFGKTIKTPANSFFIFQILPLQSEQLTESSYVVSVEVRQKDNDDNLIFRKEVFQSKLKMKAQGVLS